MWRLPVSIFGLFVVCATLAGCVPAIVDVGPKVDPFEAAHAIRTGESTRRDVHALLGDPWRVNAEWRVDVFRVEISAAEYLFYWGVWPFGRETIEQYLLVLYSDSDVVDGIRRYDWDCDWRCGEELRGGALHGLELVSRDLAPSGAFLLRLPPNLAASEDDSERVAATVPGPDECALYVLPNVLSVIYLDGRFVQWGSDGGYLRLTLEPGEHSLTCLIPDDWATEVVEGSTLEGEDDYETRPDWTASCRGGTRVFVKTVMKRVAPWWAIWGRTHGWACELSDMPKEKATKALTKRRLIIPFDPQPREDATP
jgi:hypothetical protein